MIPQSIIDQCRVRPGSKVNLKEYPTECSATDDAKNLAEDALSTRAKEILEKNREELAFVKAIAQGLMDIKQNNTMSLSEVKKGLGIK